VKSLQKRRVAWGRDARHDFLPSYLFTDLDVSRRRPGGRAGTRPRRARRWYHGSVGRAAPAWTSKISIGLRNSNHTDSLGYLHDGTIKAVHKGNGALPAHHHPFIFLTAPTTIVNQKQEKSQKCRRTGVSGGPHLQSHHHC